MLLRGLARVVLLLVAAPAFAATQGAPIPVPLPLFPPNNWWNTDVSSAPLDPGSANYIAFINAGCTSSCVPPRKLHPDWGGDVGDGTLYGFPYIVVDGSQPKQTVTFDYAGESDNVGYPIPAEAITQYGWIEEGPPGNVDDRSISDRHMLIVDSTNNYLYELYNVFFDGTTWLAGSGAFWDMNTNNVRPVGWTSADAAGLQILPGLVRYDEVYGPTEIGHALRFTVRATNGYVYPASHVAGSTTGALPMGARLRLKASKNISSFPADVQKIFRAFKKYGLIVADNGSDMYISGSYDNRWDMSVMNSAFSQLTASDFEVVQLGWQPSVLLRVDVPAAAERGVPVALTVSGTGLTGTVHFTSSDAAAVLPSDYTFTGADNGTHTFSVTFNTVGGQTVTATATADATITCTRNVVVQNGPSIPANFTATASGTTITLTWSAATGAAQYEIYRQWAGHPFAHLAFVTSTSYPDAVSSGASYIYEVRSIDPSSVMSAFSVPDVATTMTFTDDALAPSSTAIKAVHITELRTAINLVRAAAGLGAFTFTDPTLTNVAVKAVHLTELRTALDAARANVALPALAYTDPTITAGSTVIKAAHVQELRAGVE